MGLEVNGLLWQDTIKKDFSKNSIQFTVIVTYIRLDLTTVTVTERCHRE